MDRSAFICVFVGTILAFGATEGCFIHVTTNGARIQSPSYPDYENNQGCTYMIEAPQGQVITVNFKEFDIESSLRCHFDYLEFYDGWSTTSAYIGKFCGHKLPGTVTSSGNVLMAKFQSDHLLSRKGFEAVVTFSMGTEEQLYDTPTTFPFLETDDQDHETTTALPFRETFNDTAEVTTGNVSNIPVKSETVNDTAEVTTDNISKIPVKSGTVYATVGITTNDVTNIPVANKTVNDTAEVTNDNVSKVPVKSGTVYATVGITTNDVTNIPVANKTVNDTAEVTTDNVSKVPVKSGTVYATVGITTNDVTNIPVANIRINFSCPANWSSYESHCYYVSTDKRSFDKAREFCRDIGGELASIHSRNEQRFVHGLLTSEPPSYYLGLTKENKKWVFLDQSNVTFFNWRTGEPNDRFIENCVEMYYDFSGSWNDISCASSWQGSVCKRIPGTQNKEGDTTTVYPLPESLTITRGVSIDDVTNVPVTNGQSRCPTLWSSHGSHCYYVSTLRRSFEDASDFCRDIGGELASIHSMNEQGFIHGLLEPEPPGYYIGLTKEKKNWVFLDQSNVTFFNWRKGEPNDRFDENCVEMYYEHSGTWNDVTCLSAWQGSICKGLAGNVQTAANPECFSHVITSNSTIHSPSYPGYSSDQSCTYLIEAPEGHIISVHFTEFSLEFHKDCEYDYLEFYDSKSLDSPVSRKLCGLEIPRKVTSSGNALLAKFHSDGTVNERGFEAIVTYSVISDEDNYTPENYVQEFVSDDPVGVECPNEWYQFGHSCYFIKTFSGDFLDAKQYCEINGGKLACIHSAEEQAFLFSLLTSDVHSYFIGLKLSDDKETWYCTDNSEVDFTNWHPGMPDGRGEEDCAEMYYNYDGKWNDVSCILPFGGAICKAITTDEQSVTEPVSEETPSMTSCDIGWTTYGGNQSYCFMESVKEWGSASLNCADIGGHLLQVEDHNENDFIRTSMQNIHVEFIWLGINDEDEEGVWMTDDNRPVSGYTNWDSWEPNNYFNEDCAIMFLSWSDNLRHGSWYDNPCCHEFPFICEKH